MQSIDTLITVQISLSQTAAQGQNTSVLLVLTNSTVIDLKTRYRVYTSVLQVANDFGEGGQEYAAAVLWFGQNPQPVSLLIGRWAQTAGAGALIGSPLDAANQQITNFTPIVDGGFGVSLNGAAVEQVSGINLSNAATLNAVAAAVQTALAGAATVVWNPIYSRFEVTEATTGANSSVSFFTTPTGGGVTDISGLLGLSANSGYGIGGFSTGQTFGGVPSGAYTVQGVAAETALNAAILFDTQAGGSWYALVMPTIAAASDHVAVFQYCQASTTKHFYGCTTQDPNTLNPASTTDLAYLLSQASLTKGAVTYSSTSSVAIVSALARILPVDYTGQNTAINLMYKTMPGLAPEAGISPTGFAALAAKNCNVYTQSTMGVPIFESGTTPTTDTFIDTVIGADVYGISIVGAVFNTLYTTTTKVAQTDAGMHSLVTAVEGVNAQFLANNFLGAGTWNSNGFGSLNQGDYMAKGSYTYAAPVATQAQATRAKRIAVPIQVAAKLSGAINTASVLVTVNP